MKTWSQNRKRLVGNALVLLQFGLLLGQVTLAWPGLRQFDIPLGGWLTGAASGLLGVWTLAHNRLGNFNIHPAPKSDGVLVSSGPYRWIRHPMYSALLLGAAALAICSSPLAAWATWLALATVLRLKAGLEEDWMQAHHPGYAAYRRGNKRFLPWLW